MKFTVAVLACVLAAVSAQFSNGQYDPYNQFGNQFRVKPNRYQAYTTPVPYRTYRPVAPTVTIAPSVYSVTTPTPTYYAAPAIPRVVSDAHNAETVKYGNEVNPESYNYFYETSNGIAAQAQGALRDFGGNPPAAAVASQGSFSWTSPEGKVIVINYIADENGYQPSGDAIPTPPAQIARALAYTARSRK